MTDPPRPVHLPARAFPHGVAAAVALALASCGGGTSQGRPAATTIAPPTVSSATDRPSDRAASPTPTTILDGWVSYDRPAGWEIVTEADGLRPVRADLEAPPATPGIDELETLLEVRDPVGGSRVALLREPAFLDAADVDAWTEALADQVDGDPVGDDPIELAHGPGRRLRFETAGESVVLTTTAFADQRLALLVRAPAALDGAGRAELDDLVASVALDPDVVVTPLLHHHAGLVLHDVAGERAAAVGIQVPRDWAVTDLADGIRYRSPDGTATAEVAFAPPPTTSADQAMADLLDERGRQGLLDGTERDLGGTAFRVARYGPAELAPEDLGTGWLLLAETPRVLVIVRLDDTDADADAEAELLLLRRIIDTIDVRDG